MPLTVYQQVQLPKIESHQHLQALLGIEPGFLSFYRPELCTIPEQLENAEAVLVVPAQVANFEQIAQELALAYQLYEIQARSKQTADLLMQTRSIHDNVESILFAVYGKVQAIRYKVAQLPYKFKPLYQAEAQQIQSAIKQEYPFIKQRIEERLKEYQQLLSASQSVKK